MYRTLIFSSILCVSLIGCVEKLPDGIPNLSPVTIKLEWADGAPADSILVALTPEDPNNRWAASGITDSSGKATFKTMGNYSGVAVGKYKVTATKTEWTPTGKTGEDGQELMSGKELVAAAFTNSAKTTLSIDVQASGANETFKIEKR